MDPGTIRAVALFGPMAVVGVLWWWRRPRRAVAAGALLATIWNLPALIALHIAAQQLGWWSYDAAGGLVLGMPVDLLVGWMLLWGAVPVLAFPAAPLLVPLALLALLDVTFMPFGLPVVLLGDAWLTGEAAGIMVALLPGLLLGRWTAQGRRLGARAALQVLLTGTLVLWLLPLLVTGSSWALGWAIRSLGAPLAHLATVVAALIALPAVAAVQEFVERGNGTPVPYDPPTRLVRSGPYAFIRNPMQTGCCLLLGTAALLLGSAHLAAAAVIGVAYGAGLAAWHEGDQLSRRFGAAWAAYRQAVPAWRPAWRPTGAREPAVLWVATSCQPCSSVASFFSNRHPVQLVLRPAEEHPDGSRRRITYEASGRRWEGTAAIARGLEHLHLGWALTGWVMRLPVINPLLQLLSDAAGGGPRDLPQRAGEPTAACDVSAARAPHAPPRAAAGARRPS